MLADDAGDGDDSDNTDGNTSDSNFARNNCGEAATEMGLNCC